MEEDLNKKRHSEALSYCLMGFHVIPVGDTKKPFKDEDWIQWGTAKITMNPVTKNGVRMEEITHRMICLGLLRPEFKTDLGGIFAEINVGVILNAVNLAEVETRGRQLQEYLSEKLEEAHLLKLLNEAIREGGK